MMGSTRASFVALLNHLRVGKSDLVVSLVVGSRDKYESM